MEPGLYKYLTYVRTFYPPLWPLSERVKSFSIFAIPPYDHQLNDYTLELSKHLQEKVENFTRKSKTKGRSYIMTALLKVTIENESQGGWESVVISTVWWISSIIAMYCSSFHGEAH